MIPSRYCELCGLETVVGIHFRTILHVILLWSLECYDNIKTIPYRFTRGSIIRWMIHPHKRHQNKIKSPSGVGITSYLFISVHIPREWISCSSWSRLILNTKVSSQNVVLSQIMSPRQYHLARGSRRYDSSCSRCVVTRSHYIATAASRQCHIVTIEVYGQ